MRNPGLLNNLPSVTLQEDDKIPVVNPEGQGVVSITEILKPLQAQIHELTVIVESLNESLSTALGEVAIKLQNSEVPTGNLQVLHIPTADIAQLPGDALIVNEEGLFVKLNSEVKKWIGNG